MELDAFPSKFDIKTQATLQIVKNGNVSPPPRPAARSAKIVLAKLPPKSSLPTQANNSSSKSEFLPPGNQSIALDNGPIEGITPVDSSNKNFRPAPSPAVGTESHEKSRINNESITAQSAVNPVVAQLLRASETDVAKRNVKPADSFKVKDGSSGRDSSRDTSSQSSIVRLSSDLSQIDVIAPPKTSRSLNGWNSDADRYNEPVTTTNIALSVGASHELAKPRNLPTTRPTSAAASMRAQSRSIRWAPDDQLVVETRAKTQYSYSESAVRWRRRKEMLLACLRREQYED